MLLMHFRLYKFLFLFTQEKVAEARKDLADYRTKEKEGIEVDESLKCRVCGEIQLDSRLLQLHINKFHTWNTPKALNCEVSHRDQVLCLI